MKAVGFVPAQTEILQQLCNCLITCDLSRDPRVSYALVNEEAQGKVLNVRLEYEPQQPARQRELLKEWFHLDCHELTARIRADYERHYRRVDAAIRDCPQQYR